MRAYAKPQGLKPPKLFLIALFVIMLALLLALAGIPTGQPFAPAFLPRATSTPVPPRTDAELLQYLKSKSGYNASADSLSDARVVSQDKFDDEHVEGNFKNLITTQQLMVRVKYENGREENLKGSLCEYNDTKKVKTCEGITAYSGKASVYFKSKLFHEAQVKDQISIQIQADSFTLREYHYEAGVVTAFSVSNVQNLSLVPPIFIIADKPLLASAKNPDLTCRQLPQGTKVACTGFLYSSGNESSTIIIDWWNMVK